MGPVQGATYGSDELYLYSGPIVINVLEDDEDYADEEEGSGEEGYSTTRPKREMTVLSLSKDTIITATSIRPRFTAGAFSNVFLVIFHNYNFFHRICNVCKYYRQCIRKF